MAADRPTYLVFSGTSTTGTAVVHALSESGKVSVRAATRNTDSDAAKKLAALPNVEVVHGDLNDADSVKAALKGVSRAYLVSGAGEDAQFDREAGFLDAAAAEGLQGTVRCSTATALISLESTGVYARAHARIEKHIADKNLAVVDLNPDWFMHNLLGSAGEAKANGTISYPVAADAKASAFVDPRDVGRAGAAILLSDKFDEFLKIGRVEVHGPAEVTYADQVKAISAVTGKEIKWQQVPPEAWVQALEGAGMSNYFATSFKDTVLMMAGGKEPARPHTNENTPLLLEIGWAPKTDLEAWAKEFGQAFA